MNANCGNIESLTEEIAALVEQRQQLRCSATVDRERLEQNRVRIAELQWRLSDALIERYLPNVA